MPDSETKKSTRVWQEIDQLIRDWGGWSVYDDPLQAWLYGTITSPVYLGGEELHKWRQEHYIGDAGYNHETGKITHPKLRQFFDKSYPDWNERQACPEDEEESNEDNADEDVAAFCLAMNGWPRDT